MSQAKPSRTILSIVEDVEKQFSKADLFYGHGTTNPFDEAVYLVFTILNLAFDCSEDALQKTVSDEQLAEITRLCDLRISSRKPMAYLLNQAWFCGLSFYVNEDVLIPRSPIAELIADRFQPWIKSDQVKHILDIGTGSGCIACACAYAFQDAYVDAIDVEPAAIKIANKNVTDHQLQNRVDVIQSDLFSNLKDKQYDLIVSNPPYVSDQELTGLPDEYLHEPVKGLRADENGLALAKDIIRVAENHLTDKGLLIVEVGFSQQALIDAMPSAPFFWFEFENGGEGVFMLNKEQLLSISV